MNERIIMTDGVEIATQAFGDPAGKPVLLIMGAMASMLWWPEAFCQKLAAQGHYVIRYDNRDTGLSTFYEPGSPPIRWTTWPRTPYTWSMLTASAASIWLACHWVG